MRPRSSWASCEVVNRRAVGPAECVFVEVEHLGQRLRLGAALDAVLGLTHFEDGPPAVLEPGSDLNLQHRYGRSHAVLR